MPLTLYIHPLASFCHKVLIALYENEIVFTAVTVDLADPDSSADLLARWPVGKIPVLHDPVRSRTTPDLQPTTGVMGGWICPGGRGRFATSGGT